MEINKKEVKKTMAKYRVRGISPFTGKDAYITKKWTTKEKAQRTAKLHRQKKAFKTWENVRIVKK